MRSVKQFLKVEGHNTLIRDSASNAIISTNEVEYNAFTKRREIEKARAKMLDNQVQEIETIKNDMLEIKQMLAQLISTKGQQ